MSKVNYTKNQFDLLFLDVWVYFSFEDIDNGFANLLNGR